MRRGTRVSGAGRGPTAGLLALAGAAVGVTLPFAQWFSAIQSLRFPLGVIPLAFALVLLIYFARDHAQRRVREAAPLHSLAPFTEVPLARRSGAEARTTVTPEAAGSPSPTGSTASSIGEGNRRASSNSPGGYGGSQGSTDPGSLSRVLVWRKDSVSTIRERWAPESTSFAPSPPTHFARNLLAAFALFVVTIVLFRHPFFYVYNLGVNVIGTAIYWPLHYPSIVLNPSVRVSQPDYIFLVYIAFMLAYLLASGLVGEGRFRPGQRRTTLALFALYPAAEALADVVFFTVGEPFSRSAYLLIRGLLGGAFLAAIILSSLDLPRPVRVGPERPAEPGVVGIFFLSVGVAAVFGLVVLYFVFRYLGIGRGLTPIGILLLLPFLTITIWVVIGRAVYEYYLRKRPVPPEGVYTPGVSILIPAYNEEAHVEETVRAADRAASKYRGSTEILVGNDGSTDRTGEVARRCVAGLEHARGAAVDLPHGGKANVLNALLRLASGEIIIRIDADTRISETLGFAKVVGHFADPEVGGVQGLVLPLQSEGWTRGLRHLEIAWTHLFIRPATMGFRACQVVDGAFCAFRRQDLLDAGGWVPWNGEDSEITLRLQRKGYRMRFEPGAAAFEDVPENYAKLQKQRIRWNRGGVYAHYRHLFPSLAGAYAFGGLAMLFWAALFIRSGLRSALYLYVALAAVLAQVPTYYHLAIILGILLIPRGIAMGYFLVQYNRSRYLPWILAWPVFSVIKQHFTIQSFGTMFPGAAREYA